MSLTIDTAYTHGRVVGKMVNYGFGMPTRLVADGDVARWRPTKAWTLSWRLAMPILPALRANSRVEWRCSMPAKTVLSLMDVLSRRAKCLPSWEPARFPFLPLSLPNCLRVLGLLCASCSAAYAPRPNTRQEGAGLFWLVKRLTCQNKPVPFWSVAVWGRIGNAR